MITVSQMKGWLVTPVIYDCKFWIVSPMMKARALVESADK
jgi:hypothetical protein